jgi:hypothetical protein
MAKGRSGGDSKTRRKYMLRLLGEILTGKPEDTYHNVHMERGHVLESEARDLYAMLAEVEPKKVGFIRNFGAGCSPDSLVDTRGMVEIKSKLPSIQLEVILAGEIPTEHKAQLQGQLWVAEREWVDFVSYWPGLKPFVKRVYRDEPYIAAMKIAVEDFNAELQALRLKVAA